MMGESNTHKVRGKSEPRERIVGAHLQFFHPSFHRYKKKREEKSGHRGMLGDITEKPKMVGEPQNTRAKESRAFFSSEAREIKVDESQCEASKKTGEKDQAVRGFSSEAHGEDSAGEGVERVPRRVRHPERVRGGDQLSRISAA